MRAGGGLLILIAFTLLFSVPDAVASAFSINMGGVVIAKEIKSIREQKTSGVVTQKYDYSCGSAAMATLLSYFNDDVEEKDIIDKLLKTGDVEKIVKRKGFSLLDLKRYAEGRGYKAEGYRAEELADLEGMNVPVLLPIIINNYKHFVVFKKIEGDRVYIADPAKGNVTMPYFQFEEFWFKNVFLVVSSEEIEKTSGIKEIDASYMDDTWRLIQPGMLFAPTDPGRFKTH